MVHTCKNEERLRRLETQEAVMGVKLESLIKQLAELTTWIKYLIGLFSTITVSSLAYLIVKWVER